MGAEYVPLEDGVEKQKGTVIGERDRAYISLKNEF